ncbi:MAG: LysR family transcriptional regulator [Leisingera sp.]
MRRYNLPSFNALAAFEAVARLQGFARAADELNTSQPAISRHIRNLELRLGAPLFDRSGAQIRLTRKGEGFYASVVQALDGLQRAAGEFSKPEAGVTITCTYSVSHLLLLPRHSALRSALGAETELRFVTAEYNLTSAAADTGADIVFEYSQVPPERTHVVVCKEEVKPVGTPEVLAQASAALAGRGAPPGVLGLRQENFGWLRWEDWQGRNGGVQDWPQAEFFDNYVFLLEAAAQGRGLALGWRGFADPYLERGQLQELPGDWFSRDTWLFARLTRFGEQNPAARKCLALLENIRMLEPLRSIAGTVT